MRNVVRRLWIVTVALSAVGLALACGGDVNSPPPGGGGDTPAVRVVISRGHDSLIVGQQATYSAWAEDATGRRVGSVATWSLSDTTVARVVGVVGGGTAVVTARRAGTAVITATVRDYVGRTDLLVRPLLSVSPRLPSLFAGDTIQLSVTVDDGDGPVPAAASFVARQPATASVSAGGLVRGESPGLGVVVFSHLAERDSVTVAVVPMRGGVNREIAYQCGSARICVAGAGGVDTVSPAGETAEDLVWSPDGSKLLITYSGTFAQRHGVYVSAADGSDARLMAAGGRAPSWAPDGTRFAYEGSDGGIMIADLATGAQTRLTDSNLQETGPQWSPDGRQIAFIGAGSWTDLGGGVAVRFLTLLLKSVGDTVLPREVPLPVIPWGLTWSPDGRYIAFTSAFKTIGGDQPWGVWVIEQEGRGLRPLSANCSATGLCIGPLHLAPSWSPDARRLAWGVSEGEIGESSVLVARLDGTVEARVRVAGCCYLQLLPAPRWSPDGTAMAYVARAEADSTRLELRVSAPDGSGARTVTQGPLGGPRWRPSP